MVVDEKKIKPNEQSQAEQLRTGDHQDWTEQGTEYSWQNVCGRELGHNKTLREYPPPGTRNTEKEK